jgi:uncharacterized DUF497 family protein
MSWKSSWTNRPKMVGRSPPGSSRHLLRIGKVTRSRPEEAEDVFFHEPLVVRSDVRHSRAEKRHYALGLTGGGRRLFIVFTIRRKLIRVISARNMNRNEAESYARYEEENS